MKVVTCLFSALALGACSSAGGGGDTTALDSAVARDSSVAIDSSSAVDASTTLATTVAQMRQTPPTNNAMVALTGAVVVGRVSSTSYGHIWVQDAGGGMYSGIHLFCDFRTAGKCPMNRAMVDAISVSQVVNVTGKWNVFTPTAPVGAQPEIEIQAPMVTATGQTMTPVATVVSSAALIAKSKAADPGSKPYWGAYVKVTGPFVPSNLLPTYEVAQCSTDGGTANTSHGFEATGGGQTLVVDLGFYKTLVTRCLPQCPGFSCNTPITATSSFSSITGVVEPDFSTTTNDVFLKISPVTDADLPN